MTDPPAKLSLPRGSCGRTTKISVRPQEPAPFRRARAKLPPLRAAPDSAAPGPGPPTLQGDQDDADGGEQQAQPLYRLHALAQHDPGQQHGNAGVQGCQHGRDPEQA